MLGEKLPIGVQDFAKLRTEGYKYIDKTGIVYRLANAGCYYFLSRPGVSGRACSCQLLKPISLGGRICFPVLR